MRLATINACPQLQKGSPLLMEISRLGFRFLRPSTEDPLRVFPWGQIHSWAHDDQLFNFRFFDENKRSIVQHVVLLQHLNKLLGHIQLIIDQILEERKSQVISDEGFHRLLQQLQQQAGQDQMQLLATNAKHHYFMARQGRQLLEALASGFDKVEASVLLHGRLVDQNCFAHMLEALDSPADRDNVWHRIILARKAASHP
ncbi:DUF4476 domain-containing protein [Haematococcus lacustris]|uniref:DUF4476 domain-containing protein n=1 Tax=Haematococcus lacustris TaxID=44745 RepID=A0A699YP12_HAELA|nr:DUF4476 domain-containing protein [Haematococcus lacustris]